VVTRPKVKAFGFIDLHKKDRLFALRQAFPARREIRIPHPGYSRGSDSVGRPMATHLAVSPDGRRFLIGYEDVRVSREAFAADVVLQVSRVQASAWSGPVSALAALALRPEDLPLRKGVWVSMASRDGDLGVVNRVVLLDLDGENRIAGQFQWDAVGMARFSPDGSKVAVNSRSGGVEVRDAATGEVVQKLPVKVGPKDVFDAAWNRLLARTGDEKAGSPIRLVDVATGRDLRVWQEAKPWGVFTLSPDGHFAASGDDAGVVRLWDADGGRELARWQAHEAKASAMSFHPDGRTLVTGAADGSVKLWNLPAIRSELAALGLHW
jgi:WD40 repeat protein